MSDASQIRKVHIVGTGLIGTSIGLALTSAGVEVTLSDRNDPALDIAISRGAGRALRDDDEPELVVVAVPPRSVALAAAQLLEQFTEATVTDVASVKSRPIRQLRDLSEHADRFVGGHPMAGRETSGPAAARADLFEDRLWVITADPSNSAKRVADVEWLAAMCGSVVVALAPDAHDRAVALTSHTPQLLATILSAQLADADAADVAVSGQGLRDATRLAAGDPDLWSDILVANSTEVVAIILRVQQQLEVVANALAAESTDGQEVAARPVLALFEKGNLGQSRLPDKHGGAAHLYETVPVVVSDQPGELARLFAAAGAAGVNLEDVRIEHTVGRQTAIVELAVTPEAVNLLRQAVKEGGWRVRG